MRHEVYSCLKMLESLRQSLIGAYKTKSFGSYESFHDEYFRITLLLKKYLTEDEFNFIPGIQNKCSYIDRNKQKDYIFEIAVLCESSIAYLKSLEMDLDKELTKQKEVLKEKEKELEYREKEIEHLQKLLKKSLDAIKQYPELQRSKTVEEIKKSHRSIEKHSRDK